MGWGTSLLGLVVAGFAITMGVLIATQGLHYSADFTIMDFLIIRISMRGSKRRISWAWGFAGILTAVLDTYSNTPTLGAIAAALGGID